MLRTYSQGEKYGTFGSVHNCYRENQCIFPPWSKSEALQLGVHFILLYFIRISLLTPKIIFFPPGSKCEALRLGVHLILFYFIRISLLTTETFVLFGWWREGGGWRARGWMRELRRRKGWRLENRWGRVGGGREGYNKLNFLLGIFPALQTRTDGKNRIRHFMYRTIIWFKSKNIFLIMNEVSRWTAVVHLDFLRCVDSSCSSRQNTHFCLGEQELLRKLLFI